MTVAKGLFYLVSVFLAAVILLGFYILYRQVQTPTGAEVVRIFKQGDIASIPPTSCRYETSDFEGTGKGVLLIYKGNILLETATLKGNTSGQLRAVVSRDGTYRIDPGTSAAIREEGDSTEAVDLSITSASWMCSPWWFPDATFFNVSE